MSTFSRKNFQEKNEPGIFHTHHVVQSLVLSSAAACLFVFLGEGLIAAFLSKSTEKEITTFIQ